MAERLAVPVLILLGICLAVVCVHFVSDEMGLTITQLDETYHHDHPVILPGFIFLLTIQRIISIPIYSLISTYSTIQQPPSPPPNNATSA